MCNSPVVVQFGLQFFVIAVHFNSFGVKMNSIDEISFLEGLITLILINISYGCKKKNLNNSQEFSAIQTTHNLRRVELLGISGNWIWGNLRALDFKYRETLARLKKSKILIIFLEHPFREIYSKTTFQSLKNQMFPRKWRKTKIWVFT